MRHVGQVEQAEHPVIGIGASLSQLEDRAEAAEGPGRGTVVGVTGGIEVELAEACTGSELSVLGAFEGRCLFRFGQRIGTEGRGSIHTGVVYRDPVRAETVSVAVQLVLLRRCNVSIDLPV